jgi:hypothetical protein
VVRYDDLPGAELVLPGIEDLKRGVESVPALLVAIGRPRLARLGLDLPSDDFDQPEHRLYALLAAEHGDAAHSRYNALLRRLVSFERAATLQARWAGEAPQLDRGVVTFCRISHCS